MADQPILENTSLRNSLQSGLTTVEFRKKDGSLRVMKCTTNFDLIPTEFHPKEVVETPETPPKPVNENLFKVFEIGNGWRSFNFDQIIKWEND